MAKSGHFLDHSLFLQVSHSSQTDPSSSITPILQTALLHGFLLVCKWQLSPQQAYSLQYLNPGIRDIKTVQVIDLPLTCE